MEVQERLTQALADRYRIEREIGSGGMATVYLAEDLKHERQVAVKVLDPDLAQSLGAERFLRWAERYTGKLDDIFDLRAAAGPLPGPSSSGV
jgi:serine/threonine protein kinase